MAGEGRPSRNRRDAIWIGADETLQEDGKGWFRVISDPTSSDLGLFEPPVNFGDATRRSQSYISTAVYGDFTGGIGIEEATEATDQARLWFGILGCDEANQVSLPPLVRAIAPPPGVSGACRPLGRIGATMYVAFGADAVGWDEVAGGWYGTVNALGKEPTNKAVRWRGFTWVPCGVNGHLKLSESSAGALTVAGAAGVGEGTGVGGDLSKSADAPTVVGFCVWSQNLYALTTAGCLAYSTRIGNGWEWAWSDAVDDFVRLDESATPKQLVTFVDRAGGQGLWAVTGRDVAIYDITSKEWVTSNMEAPPHPNFGDAAAVWRTGEDLWVAGPGLDVMKLTAAGVAVPFQGPSRDHSLPAEYCGAITDLCATPNALYALVKGDPSKDDAEQTLPDLPGDDELYVPDTGSKVALLKWTGIAWQGVWDGGAEGTTTWMTVADVSSSGGNPVDGYALWWGDADGAAYRTKLLRAYHNPKQRKLRASMEHAEYGWAVTPWFDAAMLDFRKKASHLWAVMDHATLSEYCEFSYQTGEMYRANPDAWAFVGRADAAAEFAWGFSRPGASYETGIAFDKIRFRLEMRRRPDAPRETPLLNAFVFNFLKKPFSTDTFQFNVVLPKRSYRGRTAREMLQELRDLNDSDGFLLLVHKGRTYRGAISSLSGLDAPGGSQFGGRKVTFVQIKTGTGAVGV